MPVGRSRCVGPAACPPAAPPRSPSSASWLATVPSATMSLSLFPRAVAPLRLAARSAAPSAGVLTRWAASTPAAAAPAGTGATPTPAPAPAVVAESTAGASYATAATSSARNSPVANLQGAQPIGNSEYVVRLGARAAAAATVVCAGCARGGAGRAGPFLVVDRGVSWSVK